MPTPTQPFTTRQAALRKFLLQFLCNFASAVLNNETGDLLEYCHLLKHPKYKDVWSKLFGKEVGHLATTTKTIAFMSKQDIPQARFRDITYGWIVCNYCPKKKDPHHTHITMEGIQSIPPTTVEHQPQTYSLSNFYSTVSSPRPMQCS